VSENFPSESEIRKALDNIGLELTDQEITKLLNRESVSVANRSIGTYGSILMKAEEFAKEQGRSITVQELERMSRIEPSICSGISVKCWKDTSNPPKECCLVVGLFCVGVSCTF
jgi:hypothetical protein